MNALFFLRSMKNYYINRLSDWGKEWRVAFEPSKSQAMTVTLQRAQLALPSLLYGGNPVPESSTIKLLGPVTFDPELSFAEHIRAVSIRGKQRLGILRRAAPYLSREGRVTVYKGRFGVCSACLDGSCSLPSCTPR